ncbi:MAG: flippase-like domain-containing protein [Bacteroidetes bacterium]|nr:flippase-like domain-containing protein [Bacteroidota bacterium]
MKRISNLLIYISIPFVIYYLISQDLLSLPIFITQPYLIISLIFLFMGFLLDTKVWHIIVKNADHAITWNDSVISAGLNIFAKYIPGKVWVIIGRANIISSFYLIPLRTSTSLSFFGQLILILNGFLVGILGFLFINYLPKLILILIITGTIILIFLVARFYKPILSFIITKLFRKEFYMPNMTFYKLLKVNIITLSVWFCWSISFYYLLASMSGNFLNISTLFSFPFAATVGILTIISPGGAGIREGMLTWYLVTCGMTIQYATTAAVLSRLWFLVGELFIFIFALLLNMLRKKTKLLNSQQINTD